MSTNLILGDCLSLMKDIPDKSIDQFNSSELVKTIILVNLLALDKV